MWWVLFFFSVNSVGLNWTGIGSILLNLLFFGSTGLTEKISRDKYPKYALYQKTTPRLYPLPASKSHETLLKED
jgi:steroid 5-alpha reductase family enzyme